MKSIPNKFSFYHAGTTQRYDVETTKRINQNGECTWNCGDAIYSESEIRYHIADGDWWIVPQEPEERELVFPFTFKSENDGHYEVYKDTEGDMWWKEVGTDWHSTTPNLYTTEAVKRRIKGGFWIVTSVGEQKPPEAPTSPSKDVGTYTVKINSDGLEEALKAAKELSDVVDSVNAGLERMNELLGQISGGAGTYSDAYVNMQSTIVKREDW